MAVDTAAKRASACGFGHVSRVNVIPDGTISQGDRQTIANSYSGILSDALAAVTDYWHKNQGRPGGYFVSP